MLTADELLAGSVLEFEINVPAEILAAAGSHANGKVRMRPLTVRDLQLITRAAKDSDVLTSALMVQASLLEPKLSVAQASALQVGLLQFLLAQVNRISGIGASSSELKEAAEDPLVRAAFLLAKEFGWTPQQVSALTLGQLAVQLQLLRERQASHAD